MKPKFSIPVTLGGVALLLTACSSGPKPGASPAPMTPDQFVAKLQSLPPTEQRAYEVKWPGEMQYIERLPANADARQKLIQIMWQSRSNMPGQPNANTPFKPKPGAAAPPTPKTPSS
jgi:hypothetical protein